MNKSTAIKEIIAHLNELVKPYEGKKINDFHEFHQQINKLTFTYLHPMGLEYGTWFIQQMYLHHPTSDIKYEHLFQLEMPDTIPDKRSKYKRKATIVKIFWSTVEQSNPHYSLQEYEMRYALNYKSRKVMLYEKSVESAELALTEAKESLVKLNQTQVKIK